MKSPMAVRNRPRLVNFWMRNAVIGIMIPLTNMKLVVTHCASPAVMSKYFMKAGSAVFNRVWLRMMTKAPMIKTVSTALRFIGWELPESAGLFAPFVTSNPSFRVFGSGC